MLPYKFSTKLPDFQAFDISERLMEEFLMNITRGNFEFVGATGINQARRQNQQFAANRLQRRRLPFVWQAKKLEPVDQIVAQKNQIKIDLIGQKAVGGNISQREAFFELPDIQLASGSRPVKMPYAFCVQRKIGDKNVIKIVFEFPECKLNLFLLSLWLGAPDYDKTMGFLPIVRLIDKLGRLPAVSSEGMITEILDSFLNRAGYFGYNCVTDILIVERLYEFVV